MSKPVNRPADALKHSHTGREFGGKLSGEFTKQQNRMLSNSRRNAIKRQGKVSLVDSMGYVDTHAS